MQYYDPFTHSPEWLSKPFASRYVERVSTHKQYIVIVDQYSGSEVVVEVIVHVRRIILEGARTNCLSQLHLGMTPLKKYATRQFQDAVVRHAATPQGDNCDHMEFEIQNVCNL